MVCFLVLKGFATDYYWLSDGFDGLREKRAALDFWVRFSLRRVEGADCGIRDGFWRVVRRFLGEAFLAQEFFYGFCIWRSARW